jgi:CoA:oxalate CoA-transferase
MLSDLGAEVIKIEQPPKGDAFRNFTPFVNGVGLSGAALNRGKRSLLVDLRSDEGKVRMESLLADADVLIDSWRPGVAERLGFASDRLRHDFPRLVHVSISGYGPTGPFSDRPAFDGIIQAESGVAGLDPDRDLPRPIPSYIADKATSVMAVQAALAGLVARAVSGEGTAVDLPMIDSVAYFNFPDLLVNHMSREEPAELPPRCFTASILRASDGHVAISPARASDIRSVSEVLGHPEWPGELRELGWGEAFRVEFLKRANHASVAFEADALAADLVAEGVPAAVVLDALGHFAHPQVAHNRTYQDAVDDRLGRYRFPRHPARYAGVTREHAERLPAVGADDDLPVWLNLRPGAGHE